MENGANPSFAIFRQFKLSTRIFSGVIFYQLACGSAFISTTLFQLDLVIYINFIKFFLASKRHLSFFLFHKIKAWGNFDGNFFVIVCVAILSIMCILPYCLFASELTLQLGKTGDDAYHSEWYAHPVHLQKYIKWVIIYAQIPRNFDGYNIFKCTLEVFTKVFSSIKECNNFYL